MENLSIDDFIRIEEYLSKKLDESCALFKILIVNKTSSGQQLSRDEFERIKRDARQQVKNLFREVSFESKLAMFIERIVKFDLLEILASDKNSMKSVSVKY